MPKKVAVIGGGIAGCSAAYHIGQAGFDVTLFEQEASIASQSSSNPFAIIFPRIELIPNAATEFYKDCFNYLTSFLENCSQAQFTQCGVLIIPRNCTKRDYAQRLKDIASITDTSYAYYKSHSELEISGLFIPKSGYFSIPNLCEYLSSNFKVQYNTKVIKIHSSYIETTKGDFEAEYVIIAHPRLFTQELVKGQISFFEQTVESAKIDSVICQNGYILPSIGKIHHVGATFDKSSQTTEITEKSHMQNRDSARFITLGKVVGGKVGFRAYSKDRMPIIDYIGANQYVTNCHGSRGSLSGFYGGKIIADHMKNSSEIPECLKHNRKGI